MTLRLLGVKATKNMITCLTLIIMQSSRKGRVSGTCKYFSYFSMKTYDVSTHIKCLNFVFQMGIKQFPESVGIIMGW